MLTHEQRASFERDGYVCGGRLISDDHVQRLRGELDRMIKKYDHGHTDHVYIGDTAAFCQRRDCFLQITNMRELSRVSADQVFDPELLGDASQLLGTKDMRVFGDSMLYKNGRDSAMNGWHQDGRAFDIVRDPHKVLTAWIALDDVGKDDGCVCFASGSHKWSGPPQEGLTRAEDLLKSCRDRIDQPDNPIRAALLRRGEVHFHHGLTWHCSLPNQTGKDRRGFVVHYVNSDIRFNAAGTMFFKRFIESHDGEPVVGRHFPEANKKGAMSVTPIG